MTLLYFIKCFVSMGITWSIYKLVLADKKSFLFNRGFLLVSIVGLAIVPFLSLPSSVAPVVETMMPQIEDLTPFVVNLTEAPGETAIEPPIEAIALITPEAVSTIDFSWTWILYLVGFMLLLRIIYNIAQLSWASYRNHSHSEGEIRIIDSYGKSGGAPFEDLPIRKKITRYDLDKYRYGGFDIFVDGNRTVNGFLGAMNPDDFAYKVQIIESDKQRSVELITNERFDHYLEILKKGEYKTSVK